MFAWKGENLIRLIARVWPVNIIIGASVVALKSQTLIVLSVAAVARKFSYLLKSIDRISFVWACMRFTSLPVLKSHTRAVWSPLQLPNIDSWVGCHIAEYTVKSWANVPTSCPAMSFWASQTLIVLSNEADRIDLLLIWLHSHPNTSPVCAYTTVSGCCYPTSHSLSVPSPPADNT